MLPEGGDLEGGCDLKADVFGVGARLQRGARLVEQHRAGVVEGAAAAQVELRERGGRGGCGQEHQGRENYAADVIHGTGCSVI